MNGLYTSVTICVPGTDADNSYTWGPMATADVRMAGEQAASVPIQLVGAPGFAGAPDDCSSGGTAADTVSALWGLPFFFGRPTFIGIEGQTSPGGTGPYWAY